jgi:predicted CXXCH cytochrome family protein
VAVKDYKVLHGPVNVNACDACHTLTNASKHTFAMSRDKTATCTFCHKIKIAGEPVVHKPVLTGDCSPCHNPHGGANKKLLRGQTMVELCLKCHKDVAANKKAVHGPVAAGACGSCHLPHTSPLPKLLAAKGRDLCLGCHTEMKKQMASAKFTHKAVQGDCSQCHDPHASDFVMQTRKPPLELCTTACHQKVRAAALEAPQRHSIVTKGQACLNCHTAHGGELANLMKNTPVKACMTCHDKKIELGQGHVVAAVPEVLDPLKIKHGPVRQGNCGGCHAVHGGQYTRLLTAPYPETFYEPFRLETYGLCFTCHNKELCLRKESTTVTAFRNGSRNLHYVHVNKGKQGRTCRACHSTHASTNPVHVRESVPYGNWQLPVNYTATATGGRCASGCHRELAYDRNNPVVLNGDVEAADDTSLPGAAATLMTSTRPTRSPGGTAKPPALLKPAPSATAPASSAPAGPTASPAGPAVPIQSGRPMTRPVSLLGGPAALGADPDGMGKPSVGAVWLRDLIGPTTAPANSKSKEK